MNASATIRASYIRQTRMSFTPFQVRPFSIEATSPYLESRPGSKGEDESGTAVQHIEHREQRHDERTAQTASSNVGKAKGADVESARTDSLYMDGGGSLMDLDDEFNGSKRVRLKKMCTIFPYRDPIWLVAVVFAIGSIGLIVDAFLDLLPHTFEIHESIAIPTTVLFGSILFFAAGIVDTFAALNVDRGTLETVKENGKVVYRPALLGSPEFRWRPSSKTLVELLINNTPFQAGLLVLVGGVIFMFAGIVIFPGVIPEDHPFFSFIVFGPQVIHGALFFIGNAMLALSEQERWYIPKIYDADWQGAFLNTMGGFALMMTGFSLFSENELSAAIAAMIGSWLFLIGSLMRWYTVMEFW